MSADFDSLDEHQKRQFSERLGRAVHDSIHESEPNPNSDGRYDRLFSGDKWDEKLGTLVMEALDRAAGLRAGQGADQDFATKYGKTNIGPTK